MQKRTIALFAVVLLTTATGFAKDKKKSILPAYVLTARTVTVMIDPDAGVSVDNPRANEIALKDVEAALLTWGRFELLMGRPGADLIIVIRRGHGRLVEPTISDPRQNNRAGSITPIDGGLGVGVQHGQPPGQTGPVSGVGSPHPEIEGGGSDDSFAVYRVDVDHPDDARDSAPAWRYVASDALQSPSVPAVDKFRKAIADAEKAASKGP
jgi:hypothetical protein